MRAAVWLDRHLTVLIRLNRCAHAEPVHLSCLCTTSHCALPLPLHSETNISLRCHIGALLTDYCCELLIIATFHCFTVDTYCSLAESLLQSPFHVQASGRAIAPIGSSRHSALFDRDQQQYSGTYTWLPILLLYRKYIRISPQLGLIRLFHKVIKLDWTLANDRLERIAALCSAHVH